MSLDFPSHSRRSFLKLGATALAGVTLAHSLARAADQAADAGDDAYGGLPLGLQSYTLRDRTFDKALEAMEHDLDLHRVELFSSHVASNAPPPKLREALKKLEAHHIKAVSYGVSGFTRDHDANRKVFEFAKAMGMSNLSADPDPDSFDSLDKLTEEYRITIAIHDHGPGHRYGKIEQIQSAIKDHSKMIGLCNDTGHFIRAGVDPLEACHVFKDRMYAMHLKDFKKDAKGEWEDCILGDGSLQVEPIVKFLLDNSFRGALLIEYEGANPVEATKVSEQRVKDAVKKAK